MGLRYPDQTNSHCFFVTTTFKDHMPLGEIPGVYEALAESLIFYSAKYDARIAGYVFMPTHIHLLMFIDGPALPAFMRDLKKYIAQKAVRDLGLGTNSIWSLRYDRVAVVSDNVFRAKLDYIHNNPVKANLVGEASEWKWSSAGDYLSEESRFAFVWKEWG